MNFFEELFLNFNLDCVVAGWLFAQILKVFTGVFRQREFSLRAMLFGNGGMPSSHTAAVAALATSVALSNGVGSVAFAISALLCIIVMNDAVGVRREAGKHSKLLNVLLGERMEDGSKPNPKELFKEFLGHTPLQVFFGLLTGVGVAFLMSLIPVFGIWS